MTETPPILFLIFNRPAKTKAVLDTIRAIRPSRLYIAADGPRSDRPADIELCQQTRALVDTVDWPCEVRTLFRDDNLGCRQAVSGAITWFFDQEPEGIILEDDVLVDPSFIRFAAEMLDRYRDDPRVMSITACNVQPPDRDYDASYYFSYFKYFWGWASWRRAWELYDGDLADLNKRTGTRLISNIWPTPGAIDYWYPILKDVRDGKIDSWGYVWHYSHWKNNSLVITPKTNLMQNIGFDQNATHTTSSESWEASLRAGSMHFPISHPKNVERWLDADLHIARNALGIRKDSALKRIRKTGKKIIRRLKSNGRTAT
ncbi:MAG: hypothetical protein AAGF30_08975 [Pseudomonadota bacterium]